MSDLVIEVDGLVKRFGATVALDGLDLEVHRGEVHGFLGPNGSGKSTTIRVLLGLLRADGGTARLLGGDPWREAVALHRRLAYVPGDVDLWPNLTGGEAIDVISRLRGGLDRARRDAMVERFGLDPTKRGRTYSKGNRQKVALVAALAADVELLVLDEPTSGLDPLMEAVFQDCIREATAAGCTVLLSSHILAEVEALCDRVSIIRQGRTVESGSLDELRHLTRTSLDVEVAQEPTGLEQLAGIHGLRVDPVGGGDVARAGGDAAREHRVRFDVDTHELGAAIAHLSPLGIRSLASHPPTLEELFLRHYGDDVLAGDDASTDEVIAGDGGTVG